MPLRKLPDLPLAQIVDNPCMSDEHFPPSMMAIGPGTWEWTCPACGKKTVFTVPGASL